MIFRSFDQITTLTYFNLNLRSYGQLFVLVFSKFYVSKTKVLKINLIIIDDIDVRAAAIPLSQGCAYDWCEYIPKETNLSTK